MSNFTDANDGDNIWILVLSSLLVVAVIAILVLVYFCWKKTKESRRTRNRYSLAQTNNNNEENTALVTNLTRGNPQIGEPNGIPDGVDLRSVHADVRNSGQPNCDIVRAETDNEGVHPREPRAICQPESD